MAEQTQVWRPPGMLALAVLSMFRFSGYAALLAVAPLWVVRGERLQQALDWSTGCCWSRRC